MCVIRTFAAAREISRAGNDRSGRPDCGRIARACGANLRDPGKEPFAVMCKSLGMPRDDFFRFLRQRIEEDIDGAEQAEYLLAIFDSMARDFSRAVLRYWDWDSNPAYCSYHAAFWSR